MHNNICIYYNQFLAVHSCAFMEQIVHALIEVKAAFRVQGVLHKIDTAIMLMREHSIEMVAAALLLMKLNPLEISLEKVLLESIPK